MMQKKYGPAYVVEGQVSSRRFHQMWRLQKVFCLFSLNQGLPAKHKSGWRGQVLLVEVPLPTNSRSS